MNAKKPGVMIYFDIVPALNCLNLEEVGRLFRAIMEYGENGTHPAFEGPLALMWSFIKPKIDMDDETYSEKCLKKRYAVYCRKMKMEKNGVPYLPYEEWRAQICEEQEWDALTGRLEEAGK